MCDDEFCAGKELEQVREILAAGRRKPYRKSKLKKYQTELIQLQQQGASLAELQTWLRKRQKIAVHRSTISRFLKSLPEMGGHHG